MRESWLLPPFTRNCLSFIHFDIQSRTMKRVMVTPARLFEFPTTLTFGALSRNHVVSTVFETIAEKTVAKKTETRKVRCTRVVSNAS